jgi:hypothetical protein
VTYPDCVTRFDPFAIPASAPDADVAAERAAELHISSIEAGRRKAGTAGAVMAGAMLALRDIYEGPPKEILPFEVEASGEPHDIDRDGLGLTVDGIAVSAPALPRLDPI